MLALQFGQLMSTPVVPPTYWLPCAAATGTVATKSAINAAAMLSTVFVTCHPLRAIRYRRHSVTEVAGVAKPATASPDDTSRPRSPISGTWAPTWPPKTLSHFLGGKRMQLHDHHEGHSCGAIEGKHCRASRSEEHTSELQSRQYLVCRLLLEKK